MWAAIGAWCLDLLLTYWKSIAIAGALFLFGGCVGCEIERHRPHWFNAIGCGRVESPEPPLANRKAACPDCKGTGKVDGQPCMLCPGDGVFVDSKGGKHKCPMCLGTGKRFGECPICGGAGYLFTDGPRP